MLIFILVQHLSACKSKEDINKSSTPVVLPEESQEPQITRWTSDNENDELGFELISWNDTIYAAALTGTYPPGSTVWQ